ncbi:hypothetical protein B0H19DRAFT_1064071 [Mycena capillaripes]|nr:hypothetical protein B0H19DRAFT_1064071 [Mycena capillaripes]
MSSSRCRWLHDGAFSATLWDASPRARQLTFVVAVDKDSPAIGAFDVKHIPLICASRMTVRLVASMAAFHFGLLGIPKSAQTEELLLPTYTVRWVRTSGAQGDDLADTELDMYVNDPGAVGKGIYIVPNVAIKFALPPTKLYLSKALKKAKNYKGDEKRLATFRENILRQDNYRCVISGSKGGSRQTLQAAHLVDRYIGSIVLSTVVNSIIDASQVYEQLPTDVYEKAQEEQPDLFADVRLASMEKLDITSPVPPIDWDENGEALSPTYQVEKDLGLAYIAVPNTGVRLWLEPTTVENPYAIPFFGSLAGSATPPSNAPEAVLFQDKNAIQTRNYQKFFQQTLAAYAIWCKRFMPKSFRKKITKQISELMTQLMVEDGALDTEIVKPGEIYDKLWYEIAASKTFSPQFQNRDDEQDPKEVDAYIQKMLPLHDNLPRQLTASELEEYHQDVVFSAILLLNVGASIEITTHFKLPEPVEQSV